MTRCGVKCPVGTPIPPKARYAVWFWDFVIYHRTKIEAEASFGGLSYYEAEDAQIMILTRRSKHA